MVVVGVPPPPSSSSSTGNSNKQRETGVIVDARGNPINSFLRRRSKIIRAEDMMAAKAKTAEAHDHVQKLFTMNV